MNETQKERDRVYRILIGEIQTQLLGIERWEGMHAISPEMLFEVQKQVHKFKCQLSALLCLGEKVFGVPQYYLEQAAKEGDERIDSA